MTARFSTSVTQQVFGDLEVGDDAVLQGTDGADLLGSAAQHLLGLGPDRQHAARDLLDRDDRGLVHDDASALHVHERVRGT
jgi:hypothetical protein